MPASEGVEPRTMLSVERVGRFVEDGFVRVDGAFPCEIADVGLEALWRA
jgi:hypothetical protein